MDCAKAESMMAQYTEGGMPDALSRHIEDCPRCRSRYEGSVRLISMIGRLETPQPPEDFWGRLRRDVRQGIEYPERFGTAGGRERETLLSLIFGHGLRRVLVPAMLAVALLASYLLYNPVLTEPFIVEAPLHQELAEAGLEVYMEMDTEEAEMALLLVETDTVQGSLYYDVYALGDDEFEDLYDSLGQMMGSM